MRIAMENMPGGICYTNENMDVVVSNKRFAEMLGLPADLLNPNYS
ncbi:PAS-domain containing protein [Magnetospira sp. QH-2]|nr:PAS-domain containing protein [Magnetospira sp. QH-2]